MFPGDLGYFAPQKRFHTNTRKVVLVQCILFWREKYASLIWNTCSKTFIFNLKDFYYKKENEKCERTTSLKSSTELHWTTSPLKSIILSKQASSSLLLAFASMEALSPLQSDQRSYTSEFSVVSWNCWRVGFWVGEWVSWLVGDQGKEGREPGGRRLPGLQRLRWLRNCCDIFSREL
jgi:hypothetical protein